MEGENTKEVVAFEGGYFSKFFMRLVRDRANKSGLSKRLFVTPIPVSIPGGNIMMMNSPLLNRKGDEVGEFRVWIYEPNDKHLNIQTRVEWTRRAFGFWYRDEFLNVNDISEEKLFKDRIKIAFKWVDVTANGTVRLRSMNRLHFKKIKKSKTVDRASRVGMVIG